MEEEGEAANEGVRDRLRGEDGGDGDSGVEELGGWKRRHGEGCDLVLGKFGVNIQR